MRTPGAVFTYYDKDESLQRRRLKNLNYHSSDLISYTFNANPGKVANNRRMGKLEFSNVAFDPVKQADFGQCVVEFRIILIRRIMKIKRHEYLKCHGNWGRFYMRINGTFNCDVIGMASRLIYD